MIFVIRDYVIQLSVFGRVMKLEVKKKKKEYANEVKLIFDD